MFFVLHIPMTHYPKENAQILFPVVSSRSSCEIFLLVAAYTSLMTLSRRSKSALELLQAD